jgi:K(+)-stimulated pyrophosphate-energized sodium pump
VAISTEASLREMIIPGSLAVVVPLVIGFISVDALGGFLAGALVTGFASPSSWPTPAAPGTTPRSTSRPATTAARAATRTRPPSSATPWATPFKDTSGPSMNILIKVMTIVSLVFASAFV